MKKFVKVIAVFSAVLFAASCQKENFVNEAASVDGTLFTATFNSAKAVSGTGVQTFQAGDVIDIWNTTTKEVTNVTLTAENIAEGGKSATFHTNVPDNVAILAVYPGGYKTTAWKPASGDPYAAPHFSALNSKRDGLATAVCAAGATRNLVFANVVSCVSFSASEIPTGAKFAALSGNNGEKFPSMVDIDPVTGAATAYSSGVIDYAFTNILTPATDIRFWVLPTIELTKGFSIRLGTNATVAAKLVDIVVDTPLTIGPNAFIKLGDISVVKKVNKWVNDEAGSTKLSGGSSAVTSDWLSYENGVLSWTANTTGAPRTATIDAGNGATATINQVEAKDLVGNYTLYSYSFNATDVSNTTIVDNAGRMHETAVTFSLPETAGTINGHVHNLDINGLYLDFKAPASFEVTGGVPKIYTYLSLDYQTVSSGDEIALIPELTNSTTYATGYFAPLAFGPDNCNYAWPAWGVIDLFTSEPKFTIGAAEDRLVHTGRYFCGFSFVKKGYTESGYTTIYQLNYKNKWVYSSEGGAYFKKK